MGWKRREFARLSARFRRASAGPAGAVAVAIGAFGLAIACSSEALSQAAAKPNSAQTPPPALANPLDKRVAADLLFKRLLVKPDDLDAAFRYAELETDLGEYEAAIGSLERMLYYNPDLVRVKLQLGVLYFHLHSYEMARSYFNAVLASKDLPDDVRTEVQTYVAAVDRAVATNQFSVFGQTGLRYQTNANAGPNSPYVLALGQNALLSPEFQRTPDWNAFGLLTTHYFHDFDDQRGDGWEADLVAYYSAQFKVTRLNLGLVELQTGPRIGLGDYGGPSVHPYVIGNSMTLGGPNYLNTLGGGVSLHWPVNEWVTFTPGVEFRNRWFSNSTNYPTASGQSGGQWIGYVFGSGLVSAPWGLSWQERISFTDANATYRPYAFRDFSIDLGLPYAFAAPAFAHTGSLWTLTPTIGFSYTPYAEPDPIVDPFTTRVDRQWRVAATLDMTFYRSLGFTLQVQYLHTNSTIPNYRLQDFIVAGGPTVRF